MSQTATNTLATFQLVDEDRWDTYIKHRPGYPDSMFQRWLDYHGANNNLESIHDLGTGGGVGPLALLQALPRLRGDSCGGGNNTPIIKMVHLSDPGAANIAAAGRNLTSTRFPGVHFTFHRGRGEDPNPNVGPGTLDMVTAYECLHWTDIEPTMRNVAAYLRPGGTFAAVHYYAVPRIVNNPTARQAQLDMEVLYSRTLAERGARMDTKLRLQVATGLDFVPMDPDVWQGVVRRYVNVRNREWICDEMLLGSGLTEAEISARAPRRWMDFAREKEEVVEQDWEDWGRRGVGVQELREYQAGRMPGVFDDFAETAEWKALERAVDEGGGRVDVEIPMTMILARKK
ncbi:hypothetical protein N0V82_008230 [Gnomoniopsis sp. IMI 355080]|nr:hypothetical protein N0V82_008230 [Gnomoniopsis sp. IMI 355080]